MIVSPKLAFGLIGRGWRAEFFLRIARDFPEQFPIAGVVVRNAVEHDSFRKRWSFPVFASTEEMLAQTNPSFVVTSVGWADNLPLLEYLARNGVPVLSETPISVSLQDLHRVYALSQAGAKIQVAEQYLFQPLHAARLALLQSKRLGTVREADISVAHGYHGFSLLRHFLGVGFRLPQIRARKFSSKIMGGPGREGPPKKASLEDSHRIIAHLDYGDKLGVYDFSGDQYFSWIRSHRLLVRGEVGEVNQTTVRYLEDFDKPRQFNLIRRDTGQDGNLEGFSHQSISGDGVTFYENPFPGHRWSDDEIAVATSLAKMQGYVADGADFYNVAEACHDRYLDILVAEAVESGQLVVAQHQPWIPA